MIIVECKRHQNGHISEIIIDGHAEYDEHGFDIVCAAVSSLACTAVLGLQKICKCAGRYENEPGYCIICPDEADNRDVQIILNTMMLGIVEISKQYDQFVKVNDMGGERNVYF